ncbi:FGGY-family carbohydrate kinase [Maritalea sp.]|uniref:FGGY-family carbohydrate kinase n=1 Tax=Maritalea sp. TaxID=2003361 RepID=UPI003EF23F7E
MTTPNNIAVIDIGKTNVKLALVDLNTQTELAVVTRPNHVLSQAPYPHFDVDGHWKFLLKGLRDFNCEFGVDGISVTTHGACVALLDSSGELAAPILDYEHTAIQSIQEEYGRIRPNFEETGSPALSNGLNVGAQLFWLFQQDLTLLERTQSILTYPQYWVHRLTGVATSDVSSLGCHTDIWDPLKKDYSSMVDALAIRSKLAEPKNSNEVVGHILPAICTLTDLPANTPVVCGVHDSNASLFPYLNSQSSSFSVVSTGTWVIAMGIGSQGVKTSEYNETFINVDAFGNPVPSARFMGGREYEIMKSSLGSEYTNSDISDVLENGVMLLPAVEPSAGPFKGRQHKWLPDIPADDAPQRSVALSFYLALVTSTCLNAIEHDGVIIVEGPFAKNELYLSMLSLATNSEVLVSSGQTGTSLGAAMLFLKELPSPKNTKHVSDTSFNSVAMRAYAEKWFSAVA